MNNINEQMDRSIDRLINEYSSLSLTLI